MQMGEEKCIAQQLKDGAAPTMSQVSRVCELLESVELESLLNHEQEAAGQLRLDAGSAPHRSAELHRKAECSTRLD